ncbi:hypothetical protein GCM10027586_17500 [Kineococcus gypseus]|uniref:ANTAR domain-containing protein n=1 Tax=Kineococcus gypseus TaxID=1637102 RepID=UPI003D7C5BD3
MQESTRERAHAGGPVPERSEDERLRAEEVQRLRTEVEQLRTALARRPVIDMAKGAVMAVARCDEETAFEQLSRVSQTHNVKLFDLASALVQDLPVSAEQVPPRPAEPVPASVRDPRELVARNWTRI